MLKIIVDGDEFFDEETSEFSTQGDVELLMEHSLLSLSKWESKYQRPFLAPSNKTSEEVLFYVECMIISEFSPGGIVQKLNQKNLDDIHRYIESPESATTFGNMPERRGRGETITAELIYYWMVAFNIPFECEAWHLNRLFALIRICNVKQQKPKKMSRGEMARKYADLNAQRKAQLGTSG